MKDFFYFCVEVCDMVGRETITLYCLFKDF